MMMGAWKRLKGKLITPENGTWDFPSMGTQPWSGEGSGGGGLDARCTFSEEKEQWDRAITLKISLRFNPKPTCG